MITLQAGTIKRIHINQHNIRFNNTYSYGPGKHGCPPKPVITVKANGANHKGNSVQIFGPSKLVYRPDKPLSCGAKVWIETHSGVEIE